MRRVWLTLWFLSLGLLSRASAQDAAPSPCDVLPGVCRITREWDADALLRRREQEGAPVWADGENLTFVYQGEAEMVSICCGIQDAMSRVPGSDLWALEVHIPDLDQAVISYFFIPHRNGQASESDRTASVVWRGANAPPPVTRRSTLSGQIERVPFASAALGETRMLTVYTPPGYVAGQHYPVIYMADGESVPEFAPYLEPLIVDGTLPLILLVGAPSGGQSASGADLRAQEYLPTANPERFAQHEQFFTEELRQWAEATYGAATERDQHAVFGYSNGGVFAAAMGYRHPDLYGHIIVFSAGISPGALPDAGIILPDFYFVAGTLEPPFLGNTASIAGMVRRAGAEYVMERRIAGHDLIMWQEEFPVAVTWAFTRGA